MNSLMVDIETLSLQPNALILSIGACVFNTYHDDVTKSLYCSIKYENNEEKKFDISLSTVLFWLEQPKSIQDQFNFNPMNMSGALVALYDIYYDNNCQEIWANDASFDVVILNNAYKKYKLRPPWTHKSERSFRTIKNFVMDNMDITFPEQKNKHNALEDAIYQATILQECFKHIEIKK